MRGGANLDSSLTNKEDLVGDVEMMRTSDGNENIILELGEGNERPD